MKHFALTLALVALVATVTGTLAYRAGADRAVRTALAEQDAMAWLRADFGLTDTQFAAIKKLHDDYSVICEQHCLEIQDATRRLRSLRAESADDARLATAQQEVERLRLVCESAIATHVRRCAAEMSPDAGQRYLALVLPKIKDFDHLAPPDLKLQHRHH
jgi:hypothetical protein